MEHIAEGSNTCKNYKSVQERAQRKEIKK